MNEVVQTSPTIGSNVEEIVCKNVHFFMWDIGGQESLRSSWQSYYSKTDFVLLVIDSTDRKRLEISHKELKLMLEHDDLKKSNILILANKQDVKDSMKASEISDKLNLNSIRDHNWQIQPCCGLTGEGLNSGLQWMLTQCGEI